MMCSITYNCLLLKTLLVSSAKSKKMYTRFGGCTSNSWLPIKDRQTIPNVLSKDFVNNQFHIQTLF